jgi:hypothetical protein
MWNPVENWRQRQARQRYMPQARGARTGRTAQAALVLLAVILVAIALLELGGDGRGAALDEYVTTSGVAPLDLVERAGRSRRLVFLADIAGSAATKRFAADAIERLARGAGLDVVALAIDADEQRYIDLYLHTGTEDASLLITRPRLLHEAEGTADAYLQIFRRVRALNDELGADRKIRILALDSADWPPARAVAPHELARRFGQRDAHMASVIGQLLAREPRARVLFLLDGLHVLRGGAGAAIQTGGTRTVQLTWLAARLEREFPQDVYSILVDAPAQRTAAPQVASYRGTAAGPLLAETRGGESVGTTLDKPFGFTRQPIRIGRRPGISFELDPRGFTLPQVADAYVYLGD